MTEHSRVQIIRTPTGQLSLILPVAERLLKEGVISGVLDGDLHAADAATVKAAMVTHGVCDFCSAPGTQVIDVPNLAMPDGTISIDGWLACDQCAEFVRTANKRGLWERAKAALSYSKHSERAIADLHHRFWDAMALRELALGMANAVTDFVEDRLPDMPEVDMSSVPRTARLKAIGQGMGLSVAETEAVVRGEISNEVLAKLAKFGVGLGQTKASARAVIEHLANRDRPPLPDIQPHWQRALDARLTALTELKKLLSMERGRSFYEPEGIDLNDQNAVRALMQRTERRMLATDMGFGEDVKFLRVAQAYSFNAETIAAIREAATSIPHDAPLSSIETPNTGAGWFWFARPLPVAASPITSDEVHGLLWGWTSRMVPVQPIPPGTMPPVGAEMVSEAAISFSAYVIDNKGVSGMPKGTPSPSTRWFWPLNLSFHDMLAFNSALWDADYGPGSPQEHDDMVMGKEVTLEAISQLSLFFVMACLWFRQTVPGKPKKQRESELTTEPGHIERHARKRYVREHNLAEPPTVQVVALRRTARVAADEAPAERAAGAREYHCQWIVHGHPRLQLCGPGLKDKKLIWINSHRAGPKDKPLRIRDKVYAVVR